MDERRGPGARLAVALTENILLCTAFVAVVAFLLMFAGAGPYGGPV